MIQSDDLKDGLVLRGEGKKYYIFIILKGIKIKKDSNFLEIDKSY